MVVTEGRPTFSGYQTARELTKAGIPVTVILDSAVGYKYVSISVLPAQALECNTLRWPPLEAIALINFRAMMEKVDLVLLGAEGVVENGGLINKVGSYQVSIVAEAFKRPVYVAAESYKFVRMFPLSQQGVPAHSINHYTRDILSRADHAYRPAMCPTSQMWGSRFSLLPHFLADLLESKNNQKPFESIQNISIPEGLTIENPSCDYTPPQFIRLLFTDLGISHVTALTSCPRKNRFFLSWTEFAPSTCIQNRYSTPIPHTRT